MAENLASSAAPSATPNQEPNTPSTPPTTAVVESSDGEEPSNVIWPEDWRKRVAGDDEKLLKKAERFASPADIFKSLTEAEKRISQGFKPVELTDKSTPEEIAEYRKQNEIPEEWTAYKADIGNGVVWGDEDKPLIDNFLEHAHASHLPQGVVTKTLAWYHQFQQNEAAAIEEADLEHKTNATIELKEEWGPDYRANLNAIKGSFNAVDSELFDALFSSRNANGVLLGNDPKVVKAFAQLARQANPAAMLAPGSLEDSSKSIDQELSELKSKMAAPGYNRSPAAERDKNFARLMQLNEAKERLQK